MSYRYLHNAALQTLLPPEKWKGTPVDKRGNFTNHEYPFVADWRALLRWQTETNPQKEAKKRDTWRLRVMHHTDWLHSTADCIVWLGHSSFFIRLAGTTLLTDPVFGDVSFLVKRKAKFPVNPELLRGIDVILISHDHRDHCDVPSLQLLAKQNPDALYLSGLNMLPLLSSITKSKNIQTAGWYQQFHTPDLPITLSFLPARHWAKRDLFDTNKRLWGAFVLQSLSKTIYFSGDSGYGSHFKEAAALFPNLDYSIIGVGAYKPEWLMEGNHISPQNALKAFEEMEAQNFIPKHYGTFDLSNEALSDPYHYLLQIQQNKTSKGNVHLPHVGEPVWL